MRTTRSEIVTVKRPGRTPGEIVPAPVSPVTTMTSYADTTPGPRVIVAIPAYNEEVAIGSVVLGCRKHVSEVLVLDDGSTDRTAEIARAAGARVISHLHNEGKGAGIRMAFLYARNREADVLVLIDGDGQHNPDDIPALVTPILEGRADVVNGSRFLGQGETGTPAYRRIGQEILTLATNVGTRQKITDSQSGFRAFASSSFGCFSFRQNGMAIESEMLMDAAEASLNILEVPISVRYDVDGSTLDPITHGFGVLNKVLGLLSERRPLLLYAMPGLIMMALGILLLNQLVMTFNASHSLSVWYALGSVLFLMPGMMLISTALTLSSLRNASKNA